PEQLAREVSMYRRRECAKRRPVLELLEPRTMLSGDLGVNLGISNAYENDFQWVDATKHALGWWKTDPSNPNPLTINSLGYPTTGNASTGIYMANYPDGVYQVSYQGSASITFSGLGKNNGPFTLGADGAYHGTVVVDHSAYPYGVLYLSVTG